MSDARTIALAFMRRLQMPVIPPSYSSPDGLPDNDAALEAAEYDLLEALALGSGRIDVDEVIHAMQDPTVREAAGAS